MLAKLFLQYLLAIVMGVGVDDGYATLYGTPDDPQDGEILACGGAEIPQDKPFCAHRWLPCGTEITVINLEHNGTSVCTVADRGPYGVDLASNRWRGMLDMTPGAARATHLDGKDYVRIIYKLPVPSSLTWDDARWLSARPLVAKKSRRGPAM